MNNIFIVSTIIIASIVIILLIIIIYKVFKKNKVEKNNDFTKINDDNNIKLFSESNRKHFQKVEKSYEISYKKISSYYHFKKKNTYRICFGSCNVKPCNKRIWNNIKSYQPDLWLFLGDNYYNDISTTKGKKVINDGELLINHFNILEKMKQNSAFIKFINEIPSLSIWDDHDYFSNNKDFNVNESAKKLLKNSFLDFFNIPKDDIRFSRNGIYTYYDLVQNDTHIVRFFLLDVRSNKNNLDILGEKQWIWLEKNLKKSSAVINILVSGTTFINNNKHSESWKFTGWSFKKLQELLKINNIKNIILLSGDLHQGRVVIDEYLIEITSSSLTSKVSKMYTNSDIDEPLKENNFGFIDIDLDKLIFVGGLINLNNGKQTNLIKFKLL